VVASKGMLRDRARGMRKQPSQSERALWQVIRNRQIENAKFRRQHPVDAFIADFACVDAKLIIEIDGLPHGVAAQRQYNGRRNERLNELGWRVLVVRDEDVLTDASLIAERIVATLRATPSP
jgi:5-methyltetrahydrofolate--homocysteine methyltransferase